MHARCAALLTLGGLLGTGCLEPVGQVSLHQDAGSEVDTVDAGSGREDAGAALDAGAADAGCGDPLVMARFEACRATRAQPDCEAAGGAWSTGPFGEIFCSCPTGQAGCPCVGHGECLGECLAPIPSPGKFNDCSKLSSGACSDATPVFGCWCTFEVGQAGAICWD